MLWLKDVIEFALFLPDSRFSGSELSEIYRSLRKFRRKWRLTNISLIMLNDHWPKLSGPGLEEWTRPHGNDFLSQINNFRQLWTRWTYARRSHSNNYTKWSNFVANDPCKLKIRRVMELFSTSKSLKFSFESWFFRVDNFFQRFCWVGTLRR